SRDDAAFFVDQPGEESLGGEGAHEIFGERFAFVVRVVDVGELGDECHPQIYEDVDVVYGCASNGRQSSFLDATASRASARNSSTATPRRSLPSRVRTETVPDS